MADQFPALDSIEDNLPSTDDVADSDFLSREKELVGDEFKTDQDNDILGASDDEINDFKEQFPEVDGDEQPQTYTQPVAAADEEFTSVSSSKFEGESKRLQAWKERRDLEIEQRENANRKKKEETVSKAQQTIDDFYDNYNTKKEQHAKELSKEQEEFLEKRDSFLTKGTLWDRVNDIVGEVGEVPGDGQRDKSRFKGLLKKLKGKETVPGAGGY
ncbi:Clathrin light chain [Yamadazyma tenuis]|uniref:Clathrin light chain n=1 Tax=Candida tenuis (strain ATCC 10573 / BCRC 21748 / CBS 615 / JCM 9827 / NBRC 10315 / NRRL Y-1498 / VKM Y-70) TaxID=590646 RepID=G3B0I4_CANTC|nr:uncharacterized protein CANTEDRAFT_113148 [Yamadazyma tenuis ATCC 10573]XP_006685229.1 uncharacterized protein CANTEDRAFT_113148 [Yamadazyma tenuis ATCC 10573]EGV65542.1 hypothetical protein CANTEDRAFT_113148 [Yamadazyma tenuis ATCC 10573]EGV65543.1 hypothetical protein CANTEDRAFT_113148 [Yamadazyma tenuis ATCC 10573]WEJ94921.1 Clathrin light chain [Yamadazyma tenuis]